MLCSSFVPLWFGLAFLWFGLVKFELLVFGEVFDYFLHQDILLINEPDELSFCNVLSRGGCGVGRQ